MEVSNLLLAEQSPADRHETTDSISHAATPAGGYPTGAVYPSTTLPAIRPLHEDQVFDARPYTNEIDSLTLPEIDWQALTASLPASAQINGHGHIGHGHVVSHNAAVSKRPTKSGAPIAEVLNQASPVTKHAQTAEEAPEEAEVHKRRKLDASDIRTLPRPAPAAKVQKSKRHLLPPLLVPLHEPPPDAGLIPSMTTDGIRAPIDKVQSREHLHIEQARVVQVEKEPPVEQEEPTRKASGSKVAPATKSRRVRHTWNEEETSDLLRGVAKFGIGNWKKILECPEYKFQNRTAVDLKDRFRTCCPEEYRKVGSTEKPPPKSPPKPACEVNRTNEKNESNQKTGRKKSGDSQSTDKSSKFEHKLPDELARLGIAGPFPKAQRRTRRGFTVEEDEAILRGFEKYGAKWTKIQSDPELGLTSRSRTDLRDRFRNKFPNKFIETGHKFKQKDGLCSKDMEDGDEHSSPSMSSRPSSTVQVNGHQPPTNVVQDANGIQQSLPRLLTAPIHDPNIFDDFGEVTPSSEEQGPITLSRNIFDWADQNSRATLAARAEATTNVFELSNTITPHDQFHINPMLALKVPHHARLHANGRDGANVAPVNLFPQLPLSNILNGPVSLPSTAELVSGLDSESHH